jgi:hypothetical protein
MTDTARMILRYTSLSLEKRSHAMQDRRGLNVMLFFIDYVLPDLASPELLDAFIEQIYEGRKRWAEVTT